MSDEKEDLDALLRAPGWLRFKQYVRSRWAGEGYGRQMKLAVMESQDPILAVKVIDKTSDALNQLLSYPEDRIAEIDRKVAAAKETVDRRGGL